MIIYIYKEIVLKKSGRVRLKRVAAGEGKDGIDHDVAQFSIVRQSRRTELGSTDSIVAYGRRLVFMPPYG